MQPSVPPRLEINRLLAAAVVNSQFRHLLLNDPAVALADGYLGTSFSLEEDERLLLLSLRAESLQDLAGQLLAAFSEASIPVSQVAFAAWPGTQQA